MTGPTASEHPSESPTAESARPQRPRRRRGAAVAACVAFLVLLAVALDGPLHRTGTIGEVERQPASVTYADGRTHYVGMIQKRSLLLDRHRGYELYAGSDPGLGYGHFVQVGLGDPDARPVMKTVKWDGEGVRVTFASGHELFVPARHYVGGR